MNESMALAELAFTPWAVKANGATVARFGDKNSALFYMGQVIQQDGIALAIVFDYLGKTGPIDVITSPVETAKA